MTYYDRLTKAHYHLQIEISDGPHLLRTVRLSHKRFATWVRYLHSQGFDVSISYDNDHHTYLAKGVN